MDKAKDLTGVSPENTEGFFKAKKKPIVIEALKVDYPFEVETLEGVMSGKAGDYLLIGVKGEKYPCDAEIFEETYDIVKEEEEKGENNVMAKDYSVWEDKDKIEFEATITGISGNVIETMDYDFSLVGEGEIIWDNESGMIELDVVGGDIDDKVVVIFGIFRPYTNKYIKSKITKMIKDNLENLYDVDDNMRIDVYIE